jgi:ammonium transporter Rh
MKRIIIAVLICCSTLGILAASAQGSEALPGGIRQVEQYNFSIHVLAMLLVGFGFLMVFVKRYGYGATTGTYLVVASAIPLYLGLRAWGGFSSEPVAPDSAKALLFAEFACASALIAMGAVLGRLRHYQYLLLAALLVPAYMINEKLVLDGGLGVTRGFVDSAGSIIIHAFGAYFGLGLALSLTNRKYVGAAVETDETSDRFSMLGSMVLWIFWPSFCSAIVPTADVPRTAINTVVALCGATLSAYVASNLLRRGRMAFGDIANASLAGGVAIGATCNLVNPALAFGIGILAGALCVCGYALIQPRLDRALRIVDTCGVHNLHGMPGLLGGLVAALAVPGVAVAQLTGIAFTVVLALAAGGVAGYLIRLTGFKAAAYQDRDDFVGIEDMEELTTTGGRSQA